MSDKKGVEKEEVTRKLLDVLLDFRKSKEGASTDITSLTKEVHDLAERVRSLDETVRGFMAWAKQGISQPQQQGGGGSAYQPPKRREPPKDEAELYLLIEEVLGKLGDDAGLLEDISVTAEDRLRNRRYLPGEKWSDINKALQHYGFAWTKAKGLEKGYWGRARR